MSVQIRVLAKRPRLPTIRCGVAGVATSHMAVSGQCLPAWVLSAEVVIAVNLVPETQREACECKG
jgi:hypothetical protein